MSVSFFHEPLDQSNQVYFHPVDRVYINVDRLCQILSGLKPLTLPFRDKEKRVIQLWKSHQHGLIGAVLDSNGSLRIIPGRKIRHFIGTQKNPSDLVRSLENIGLRRWDFVFEGHKSTLILWPHLEAAGKYRDRPIWEKTTPVKHCTREELIQKLEGRGYTLSKGCNHAFGKGTYVHPKGKMQIHIDPKKGNEPSHIDVTYTKAGLQEVLKGRHKVLEEAKKRKDTAEEQRLKKEIKDISSGRKNLPRYRLAYKEDPSDGSSRNNPSGHKDPSGTEDPAQKDFKQLLQQTKLTDSYNATHRGNPVPPKGGTGGEIGGVACSIEYIQNLFETPESLFEMDHYFCLPQLPDGQLPFTNEELRQILRELAIGIYVHSTVPFFSLHFRQGSADLFPVIHPAYENTLVGRVIGMLDYFMKGYLNGGVFKEDFIDQWHKDPSWKKKSGSALEDLIDFGEHCQKYLDGEDSHYVSLRTMSKNILSSGLLGRLEALLSDESQPLSQFDGFRNSFRIISKQKSFKKTDNVFVIDTDFDVQYTVEPSPEYKEELSLFLRKKGEAPTSYQTLIQVYELMAERIHDHMVKMPLCREYFAMLGVINFFSSYFSTLKQHRKIPVLPAFEKIHTKGCPPLFPHLPITHSSKEPLRANLREVVTKFIEDYKESLEDYFLKLFKFLYELDQHKGRSKSFDSSETQVLKDGIASIIKNNILTQCSFPFRRFIQRNDKGNLDVYSKKKASELFEGLLQLFEEKPVACFTKGFKFDDAFIMREVSVFLRKARKAYKNKAVVLSQELPYNITHVNPEVATGVVEKNKRIVGGCGMELQKQAVQPSKEAEDISKYQWERLLRLEPESWAQVDMGMSKGAIFRLFLEDVPAWLIDDYEWMESLLLVSNKMVDPELIGKKVRIQETIAAGNRVEFISELDEASLDDLKNMQDLNGASLLCHAAKSTDPFYLETLLEKGLSLLTPDNHGYLPIHYAAMQGRMVCLECCIVLAPNTVHAMSHNGSSPLVVAIQHNQISAVQLLIARTTWPSLLSGGYTDLHCALHEGNADIIQAVLSNDDITLPNLNICAEEGGTPLMLACELDAPKLAQQLIAKGADPSAKRRDGVTPIEIAVKRKCLPLLQLLLERATLSSLAVELAIKEGSVQMVELMSRAGTDMSKYRNPCEDTAAHIALRHGNEPVARHLARNYPDLFCIENAEGYTPLRLALFTGTWQIVQILFNNGIVPELHDLLRADYCELIKTIFDKAALTKVQLQECVSIAAQAGNYLAINLVLRPLGAKIDEFKGRNGWQLSHYMAKYDGIFLFRMETHRTKDFLSPLAAEGNKTLAYIAAEHGNLRVSFFLLRHMKKEAISLHNHFHDRHLFYGVIEGGNIKVIKEIMDLFMEIDLGNATLDAQGTRPSHLTAKMGLVKIMKFLSKTVSDWNAADKNGHSPLFYACRIQNEKMVSFLLEKHVKVRAEDLYTAAACPVSDIFQKLMEADPSQEVLGRALYKAVYHHNFAAFQKLYQGGASSNHVTSKGWTTTLIASYMGQKDILEILLKNPHIDNGSLKGKNALHLACLQGHAHCVKLLVEAGFDANQTDQQGKTPFEYAKTKKYCAKILKGNNLSYSRHATEFVKALEEDDPKRMEMLFQELSQNESISIYYQHQKVWGPPLLLLVRFCRDKKIQSCLSKLLKQSSVDPKATDSEGNTLAHLLVRANISPLSVPNLELRAKNHAGQTILHLAPQSGKSPLLSLLIEALPPADINEMDHRGQTPIFGAIQTQDKEKIALLIGKGVSLNHYDHSLITPLLLACKLGALSIVRLLIEEGADINQVGTPERASPLHISILQKENNREITHYLLLQGAKIGVLSEEGSHAIHYAAQVGDVELLRLLIAKGISMEFKDHEGKQPAHYAALTGQTAILEALVFEESLFKMPFEERLVNAPLDLQIVNNVIQERPEMLDGATPLHLSALSPYPATTDWLLHHRGNPEAKTKNDEEVLTFAARSDAGKQMVELFDPYKLSQRPDSLLPAIAATISRDNLSAMIVLHNRVGSPDTPIVDGNTGLHLASIFGALQCTSWLLQNGADPLIENTAGQNVFEISATNSSPEQFQLLLEYSQVDPDQAFRHRQTLMHFAAKGGKLKHIMSLMMLGASLDSVNALGLTPLHTATQAGHENVVSLFLASGADTSVRSIINGALAIDLVAEDREDIRAIFHEYQKVLDESDDEESLLHFAVRMRNTLAVLFLTYIKDVNRKDSQGVTPLHLAVQAGQTEIVLHLLRAGADRHAQDKDKRTPLMLAQQVELVKILQEPLKERRNNLFINSNNN